MTRRRYKPKPFQPISHAQFRQTRLLARLTQVEVACLLHVTSRTVALWEAGKTGIPYAAFRLLKIHVGFELPGEAWKGWSIRGDTLWSLEQRPYRAGYLGYQWLTFAMADSWRRASQAKALMPLAGATSAGQRPALGEAPEAATSPPQLRLVG